MSAEEWNFMVELFRRMLYKQKQTFKLFDSAMVPKLKLKSFLVMVLSF